jgi:class 3 adenylate cyclase
VIERETDPEVVLVTVNQMMADLVEVLKRHGGHVTTFLGDGFKAMFRGSEHARRGVTAALEVTAALHSSTARGPFSASPASMAASA